MAVILPFFFFSPLVSPQPTPDNIHTHSKMLALRLRLAVTTAVKTTARIGPITFTRFQTTTAAKPRFTKSTLDTTSVSDFTLTKIKNQQLSQYNNLPLQLALTQSAAQKLSALSQEEGKSDLALRLVVSSGGCHGFQYDLKITDTGDFKPKEGDTLFERDGGRVLVDKDALEIMRDSKIDYVKELIGEGFKVVESPLTKSSCGCGSSFDVDFEKLEGAANDADADGGKEQK